MRKVFFASFLFLTVVINAQQPADSMPQKPKAYLGLGGGINNVTSLIGLSFEFPVTRNVSIKAGAGTGGWGPKLAIAAKYYKNYPTSLSMGIGFSTAFGAKDIALKFENEGVTEEYTINYNSAQMVDLTFGKAWGNRIKFNIEFGWSIKVAGGDYKEKNNKLVSDVGDKALKLISPGGLILGAGLAFGF